MGARIGGIAALLIVGCLGRNPYFDGPIGTGGAENSSSEGTATASETEPGSTADTSTSGTASDSGAATTASAGSTTDDSGGSGTENPVGTATGSSGDATATAVCDPINCDDCSAVSNGGFDYCLCAGEIDWPTALADCTARGGDLTSIADQTENDFVRRQADAVAIGEAWIGLNDLDEEGNFVRSLVHVVVVPEIPIPPDGRAPRPRVLLRRGWTARHPTRDPRAGR